jgi:hypothetical protein
VLALVASGCGEEENPALSGDASDQVKAHAADRKAKVERLVRDGDLPPVALRLIDTDGTMNINFIDGPNNDRDVVRSSADGTTGKKLAWDLDQDGRIERSERTITERELYDATLGQ